MFEPALVREALRGSFIKLNPRIQFRNPVMFCVEVGMFIMLAVCIWTLVGGAGQGSFGYNLTIFVVLLLTLLFANFAEGLAEARGKAQAASLRKTRQDTPAKKMVIMGEIFVNEIQLVSSAEL
jgi:K+-transporting ATPase ATPase B chain